MIRWISLGDINKFLLFPFVGGMTKLLLELILDRTNSEFKSHPLIKGVNAGLGMSLSIIPFIIINIRTKSLNKKIIVLKGEKNKLEKGKYILLLICSFLDFLQKYLSFNLIHDSNNNVWIFDLIFLSLFSMFILNEKLYRHQYLSLLFMIIILLSSSIYRFIYPVLFCSCLF